MKYFFVFKQSQEGIPTLIVYRDTASYMFGGNPEVVNVITGNRAVELHNELINKVKEA